MCPRPAATWTTSSRSPTDPPPPSISRRAAENMTAPRLTPGTGPNAPDRTPQPGRPRPGTRTPATTTHYPSKNFRSTRPDPETKQEIRFVTAAVLTATSLTARADLTRPRRPDLFQRGQPGRSLSVR